MRRGVTPAAAGTDGRGFPAAIVQHLVHRQNRELTPPVLHNGGGSARPFPVALTCRAITATLLIPAMSRKAPRPHRIRKASDPSVIGPPIGFDGEAPVASEHAKHRPIVQSVDRSAPTSVFPAAVPEPPDASMLVWPIGVFQNLNGRLKGALEVLQQVPLRKVAVSVIVCKR